MVCLWLLTARAASPELDLGARIAIADGTRDVPGWAGVGFGLGEEVGRFVLGGRLHFGVRDDGDAFMALEPAARLWLTHPNRTALSVVLAAGAQIDDGLAPVLSPGAALDLGLRRPIRPRLQASYHIAPEGRSRLSIGVSAVFGPQPEAVEAVEVVEIAPPPPGELPDLGDGMLWLPAPVCQWLEAEAAREIVTADTLPSIILDEAGERSLASVRPAVPEGGLVVAAWPGDLVEVNGTRVEADSSGIATLPELDGPAEVVVVGGGRRIERGIETAEGHALWVSADPPQPARVQFDVAQSVLSDEALAVVEGVAANAAGWNFDVRGGHSPEGDPIRNEALSLERANAVAAALIAAGVPADRVFTQRLSPPNQELPNEVLRTAVIYPEPPEEAP